MAANQDPNQFLSGLMDGIIKPIVIHVKTDSSVTGDPDPSQTPKAKTTTTTPQAGTGTGTESDPLQQLPKVIGDMLKGVGGSVANAAESAGGFISSMLAMLGGGG